MRANRAPGQSWSLRYDPRQGYVTTGENDRIIIAMPQQQDHGPERMEYLSVSRKDARVLAKRINACLDATTLHKGG